MKNFLIIPTILFSMSSLFLTSCGKSTTDDATKTTAQTESKEAIEVEPITVDSTAEKAKTIENMQTAYKGEVTASAKYAAYAQKAEKEGYPQIAILYKAISAAEHIHAGNHQAVLTESKVAVPIIKPEFTVKTTKENLEGDIKGEAYEATSMYPAFIKSAENANNQIGIVSLMYAMKTEKKHNVLYGTALNALQNNNIAILSSTFCICPLCGNTYTDKAPARCGFCMTKGEKFIKIGKTKANRDVAMTECDM